MTMQKTTNVAIIGSNGNRTVVNGAPVNKSVKKVHNSPAGGFPVRGKQELKSPGWHADDRGDIVLTSIWLPTPAAMNKLIPEPNPHLLTTSSSNIAITPPMANCSVTTISIGNPGATGTAPAITYAKPSTNARIIARNLSQVWNLALLSGFVMSQFIILDPTRSCKRIPAVTIGPIPNVIKLPNLEPRTISKKVN